MRLEATGDVAQAERLKRWLDGGAGAAAAAHELGDLVCELIHDSAEAAASGAEATAAASAAAAAAKGKAKVKAKDDEGGGAAGGDDEEGGGGEGGGGDGERKKGGAAKVPAGERKIAPAEVSAMMTAMRDAETCGTQINCCYEDPYELALGLAGGESAPADDLAEDARVRAKIESDKQRIEEQKRNLEQLVETCVHLLKVHTNS